MITSEEVIERLARFCPEWEEASKDELQYILIAEMGRDIIDAAANRRHLDKIYYFYRELEDILELIDPVNNNPPWSLVGAGMFEAMFSTAMYPRDFLNQFMGEITYDFWTGMIEGWYGKGIRSLSAYERVVHNQQPSTVEITWFRSEESLKLDKKGDWVDQQTTKTYTKQGQIIQEIIISREESDRHFNLFNPLMAEQALGWVNTPKPLDTSHMGFDTPYAQIDIEGGAGADKIIVGNPVWEIIPQYYALVDDRQVFTLGFEWEEVRPKE